jgi:chemotaxis protein histidine kinase CheA/CheY-like chemotaxis protein
MSNRNESLSLAMKESHELIEELRIATEDSPTSTLHRFTTLLIQIFNFKNFEAQSTMDTDAVELIQACVKEICVVAESDDSSSTKLETLFEKATSQWGETLGVKDNGGGQAFLDETLTGSASSDSLDSWNPEFDFAEQDDLQQESVVEDSIPAPSADEIASMLNALTASQRSSTASTEQQTTDIAEENARSEISIEISLDSLDKELKEAFLEDASNCVESMEGALLRLEKETGDVESLNQIGRELHTLKGASASVGLVDFADQLHALEDRLQKQNAGSDANFVNAILKCVDSIRAAMTNESDTSFVDNTPSVPTESAAAKSPISAAPATATFSTDESDGDDTVRVKTSQLNRLMDTISDLVMLRNRRETEVSDLQEAYHELIGSVSKMRQISHEDDSQDDTKSLQLSEVANDVFDVAQSVRSGLRPFADGNEALSQSISQLRHELVELRRTPISGLFRRLQRVVRDAASAESKQVRLELVGENSGIERSLQQRLYEPLLHIVRNAVCHGIESNAQREQLGKPAVGTITVEARTASGVFIIEIRDDGGGLNYDAIQKRGRSVGLLMADQQVSKTELSQLIFQPGFSTRESTNQVAGRGVGMDVVASTLTRMGGWLDVDSQSGKGTSIRLSFPIPSVIQHAMIFRSQGRLFAFPMQSIQSVNPEVPGRTTLRFCDLLGETRDAGIKVDQRIVLLPANEHSDRHDTSVTLLVDEIVGAEEVVVRSLPAIMKHHPYCNGATLSGSGELVLLLDARRVVNSKELTVEQTPSDSNLRAGQTRPRVLVADDSVTARKRVVKSLQRYAVDIFEACDGRQALEIFRHEKIDAVFSDMEMPHVTGMDLLSAIKSDDRAGSPPVVIISSRNEIEFTSRAKELGATDYLIKPLADESLDLALTKMPSLSRLLDSHPSDLSTCGAIQ